MRILILLLIILTSPYAVSFVDPENGNNFIEFVDMEPSGKDEGAPYIRRYYNSLTAHRGIFGRGWASDLETKLEFLPDNAVAVIPYGAGRIRIFENQEFQIDPGWKLPLQIELREKTIFRLKNDKNFRYQWLKENGLVTAKSSAQTQDMISGTETLTLQKNLWKFKDSAGETWTFDQAGKLIGMIIPGGGEWHLSYKNNFPDTLRNSDRVYTISYAPGGLVQKIEFRNLKLIYQYLNGLLQESIDASAKKYIYSYSSLGQLESIKGPNTHFQFGYLPNTGRVSKASENAYHSEYFYEEKKIFEGEIFTTTVKDEKGVQKIEFTYLGPSSGRYLAKLREIKGSVITETQFNPARLPTKIMSPDLIQEIFYDQNGRISEIKRSGESVSKVVRDNQSGKISEIVDRNQLRKFTYNALGKISTVSLGDGTKLSFIYNSQGFIQSADLTDLKGLSEGLLTPVYQGSLVTEVMIDGKKPTTAADKLRTVRFYQVIQDATSLPKY